MDLDLDLHLIETWQRGNQNSDSLPKRSRGPTRTAPAPTEQLGEASPSRSLLSTIRDSRKTVKSCHLGSWVCTHRLCVIAWEMQKTQPPKKLCDRAACEHTLPDHLSTHLTENDGEAWVLVDTLSTVRSPAAPCFRTLLMTWAVTEQTQSSEAVLEGLRDWRGHVTP